jgi:hypothetical protein
MEKKNLYDEAAMRFSKISAAEPDDLGSVAWHIVNFMAEAEDLEPTGNRSLEACKYHYDEILSEGAKLGATKPEIDQLLFELTKVDIVKLKI